QEKEVLRLGATEPTPVDVRVIAATHRDLPQRVASGAFRQDLYYRLNILRLELPPLRERLDDLPAIAAYLLDKALRRLGSIRSPQALLRLLLPRLRSYDWPGNVRELENIIERVSVYASSLEENERVNTKELYALLPELTMREVRTHASPLRSAARTGEMEHIRQVLAACNGNRERACKHLYTAR